MLVVLWPLCQSSVPYALCCSLSGPLAAHQTRQACSCLGALHLPGRSAELLLRVAARTVPKRPSSLIRFHLLSGLPWAQHLITLPLCFSRTFNTSNISQYLVFFIVFLLSSKYKFNEKIFVSFVLMHPKPLTAAVSVLLSAQVVVEWTILWMQRPYFENDVLQELSEFLEYLDISNYGLHNSERWHKKKKLQGQIHAR